MVVPPNVAAATTPGGARLTLQTVASLGFKPHPDWVSYLVKDPQGKWIHSTNLTVPANSLIHVTIYQYDTATGLRNPFWGLPQGTVGLARVNGKPIPVLNPDLASHTFAIPELHVTVPLKGVTLVGNGPDVMTKVTMVGNDLKFTDGGWTCGKNGQQVPVGMGISTVKVSEITVGGTKVKPQVALGEFREVGNVA